MKINCTIVHLLEFVTGTLMWMLHSFTRMNMVKRWAKPVSNRPINERPTSMWRERRQEKAVQLCLFMLTFIYL